MTSRALWRWILAVSLGPAAALVAHGCAIVGGIQAPVPATCSNKMQDPGETKVDCGGSCGTCDGDACASDAECASGICYLTRCAPPTNADACPPSVQGDRCQACHSCAVAVACVVDADCASGLCLGQSCVKCDEVGNLCPGDHCAVSTGACLSTTCANGVIDGDETGVDCGGSCAAQLGKVCATACDAGGQCGVGCATLCDIGEPCTSDADCLDKHCQVGGTAADATCQPLDLCSDGTKNDQETDVDCGGPHCAGCGAGKVCVMGSDCLSGACTGGLCTAAASCSDHLMNGDETDVDCGGSCPPCGLDKYCSQDADCGSNAVCINAICRLPVCSSVTCPVVTVGCGHCAGTLCMKDSDCASGTCASLVCM